MQLVFIIGIVQKSISAKTIIGNIGKVRSRPMYMTKASLIAIYVILSLPLIILFSIGMFAWCCAKAVIGWLTDDFSII